MAAQPVTPGRLLDTQRPRYNLAGVKQFQLLRAAVVWAFKETRPHAASQLGPLALAILSAALLVNYRAFGFVRFLDEASTTATYVLGVVMVITLLLVLNFFRAPANLYANTLQELAEVRTELSRLKSPARLVLVHYHTDVRPMVSDLLVAGPIQSGLPIGLARRSAHPRELNFAHAIFRNDPEQDGEAAIARGVLAEIGYHEPGGRLLFSVTGRWGDELQPTREGQGKTLETVDFSAGQQRELNLALRSLHNPVMYGFGNESCFRSPSWQLPEYALPEEVLVRVVLRSPGLQRPTWWFRLSVQQDRLELRAAQEPVSDTADAANKNRPETTPPRTLAVSPRVRLQHPRTEERDEPEEV